MGRIASAGGYVLLGEACKGVYRWVKDLWLGGNASTDGFDMYGRVQRA